MQSLSPKPKQNFEENKQLNAERVHLVLSLQQQIKDLENELMNHNWKHEKYKIKIKELENEVADQKSLKAQQSKKTLLLKL